jgi:hypothetical protein
VLHRSTSKRPGGRRGRTPDRRRYATERDYIDAIASYYQDWANRPERSRQESRAKAFEALAARYSDDDEAQIFSALYIAGTQSLADQTYSAYYKAATILERQSAKYPEHPGVAHYLILFTTLLHWPRRDSPPHADTQASRQTRRTRYTCRRTSSRA